MCLPGPFGRQDFKWESRRREMKPNPGPTLDWIYCCCVVQNWLHYNTLGFMWAWHSRGAHSVTLVSTCMHGEGSGTVHCAARLVKVTFIFRWMTHRRSQAVFVQRSLLNNIMSRNIKQSSKHFDATGVIPCKQNIGQARENISHITNCQASKMNLFTFFLCQVFSEPCISCSLIISAQIKMHGCLLLLWH